VVVNYRLRRQATNAAARFVQVAYTRGDGCDYSSKMHCSVLPAWYDCLDDCSRCSIAVPLCCVYSVGGS